MVWWCPCLATALWGRAKLPSPVPPPAAGAHGCFSRRDVKCGTLLCLSDNTSPVLGGGSYSLFFGRFKCKAVIASNDANEVVAKLRLVPTGAKCGEEMVSAAVLGWQRAGGDHGLQGPRAASEPPIPALRSAMPGAARTSWSTATRTARPSATTTGYAVGPSSPRAAAGPGQPSQPLRRVCCPDTFLPHCRCATTSVSVTASRAGQRPTASRRFQGWRQVWHHRAQLAPAPLAQSVCQGGSLGTGRGGVGALLWCCIPTGCPPWRGAHPNTEWVSTGGSSVVLGAVLAVLALSGVLLGSGVVLLRSRETRHFQKG